MYIPKWIRLNFVLWKHTHPHQPTYHMPHIPTSTNIPHAAQLSWQASKSKFLHPLRLSSFCRICYNNAAGFRQPAWSKFLMISYQTHSYPQYCGGWLAFAWAKSNAFGGPFGLFLTNRQRWVFFPTNTWLSICECQADKIVLKIPG